MRILAIVGAAAALIMLGSAPASAAGPGLDPDDSLFAINCEPGPYDDWQLLAVDATSAVSTTVGEGAADPFVTCGLQAAYNPVTHVSYYVQFELNEANQDDYYLATIDTETGVSTRIGQFFLDGDPDPTRPTVEAIAIGLDGAAYAIGIGYIYSLDLATAELSDSPLTLVDTWSMSVDPSTGDFFAINIENEVFEIFPDGGTTYLGDVNFGVQPISLFTRSLQIDGSGRFWIAVQQFERPTITAHLWSFTLADFAAVDAGEFTDDPYDTEALLLIPGEVLPATGPAESGALVGGAVALLALGGALVATRRIRAAR